MTLDESAQYWRPAANRFRGPGDEDYLAFSNSKRLAQFLGFTYTHANDWMHITLTPELKGSLVAISGPHGDAIIKAMKIRRGLK